MLQILGQGVVWAGFVWGVGVRMQQTLHASHLML